MPSQKKTFRKKTSAPKKISTAKRSSIVKKSSAFKHSTKKGSSSKTSQSKAVDAHRAYNMILTQRKFGSHWHNYVLFGFERYSETWVLLGGRMDPNDVFKSVTAARELWEESAKVINKQNDKEYWKSLTTYQTFYNKVFIHDNTIPVTIKKLDEAVKKAHQERWSREFREIQYFELIPLWGLLAMVEHPPQSVYRHSVRGPMKINSFVLNTMRKADLTKLYEIANEEL